LTVWIETEFTEQRDVTKLIEYYEQKYKTHVYSNPVTNDIKI